MPIKGLSNKITIPRLGKIRLGIKKLSSKGVEYPVATEYFVLPKDHPQFEALVDLFGEEPKELRILIPLEDEDKWCSQYYRCYSRSRGLVCKGDGETATRMVGKGTDRLAWGECKEVEMKDIKCKGQECEHYQMKHCNEIMNLQFMIPEIPGLGVWQIDSTSINSIKNINSMSALIKSIYKKISMIPLLLTLEPRDVNNPDDGKRKTVHVLNLRTNNKLSDLAIAAREQQEQFMLPVGDVEPPDDGLGYQPDFDPLPPDTHTVQENIDNLWGPEPQKEPAKPVEVKAEVKQQVSAPAEQTQNNGNQQVSGSNSAPGKEPVIIHFCDKHATAFEFKGNQYVHPILGIGNKPTGKYCVEQPTKLV